MSTELPPPETTCLRYESRRLRWRVVLVVAVALVIRLWFIEGGQVGNPMIGDAVQYSDYAWNLLNSYTFSKTPPGSEKVAPDSYRDPGYPLFLAALLFTLGSGDTWYHAVLLLQGILGAISAGFALLISARWLSLNVAFGAGLAVALWPHCVSISSFLLSETVFGFMLLLALWLLARAAESSRSMSWGLAGLGCGAAALVNATLSPFGVLLAGALWLRRAASPRLLRVLLIGALIFPGAWMIRGLAVHSDVTASTRAIENLVQGSWPIYHAAFKAFPFDNNAARVMSSINDDITLAIKSPSAWFEVLSRRVQREPLHYLAWYAWKPELLWAWNIRAGFGDVYPYPIQHPIYRDHAVMRLFEAFCVAVNPVLFVLMMFAVVVVLFRPGQSKASIALYAVALLVAYETLVYTVLQAEPRYSIPFRPLQMMLAFTAIEWIRHRWLRQAAVPQSATA